MTRILVIDDERDLTDLMAETFGKMGYKVDIADTGEIAIELLKNYDPAVLIVDNNLPGMDGVEVVKRVRAVQKPTAIIMLTIDREEEVLAAMKPYRPDFFIRKPFAIDQLRERVLDAMAITGRKKRRGAHET